MACRRAVRAHSEGLHADAIGGTLPGETKQIDDLNFIVAILVIRHDRAFEGPVIKQKVAAEQIDTRRIGISVLG